MLTSSSHHSRVPCRLPPGCLSSQYYPGGLNRSNCCRQGICSECFLQVSPRANRSASCPFCKRANYATTFRGPMNAAERERLQQEEQRVIEAQIGTRVRCARTCGRARIVVHCSAELRVAARHSHGPCHSSRSAHDDASVYPFPLISELISEFLVSSPSGCVSPLLPPPTQNREEKAYLDRLAERGMMLPPGLISGSSALPIPGAERISSAAADASTSRDGSRGASLGATPPGESPFTSFTASPMRLATSIHDEDDEAQTRWLEAQRRAAEQAMRGSHTASPPTVTLIDRHRASEHLRAQQAHHRRSCLHCH